MKTRFPFVFGAWLVLLGIHTLCAQQPDAQVWESGTAPKIAPGTGQVVQCPDGFPPVNGVSYHFDSTREHFFIYVPHGFDPSDTVTKYGVVVFINAADGDGAVPPGWGAILDQHKLFFIEPSNIGNKEPEERRFGLPLISQEMMKKYFPIDPDRVYIAGISGGSRIAGILAFRVPNIFQGTIQSCGTDFFRPVPRSAVTDEDLSKHPGPYGLTPVPYPQEAKAKVRFVLITGPGDFRHNFILDIYHGGFEQDGYQALLLDIPGMGHQICSGDTLEKALQFIEK